MEGNYGFGWGYECEGLGMKFDLASSGEVGGVRCIGKGERRIEVDLGEGYSVGLPFEPVDNIELLKL